MIEITNVFASQWKQDVQQSHGFVILISCTNAESLSYAVHTFEKIQHTRDSGTPFAMAIGLNKVDLISDRVITLQQVQDAFPGYKIFETSAKLNVLVTDLFFHVAEQSLQMQQENNKKGKKKDCTVQ